MSANSDDIGYITGALGALLDNIAAGRITTPGATSSFIKAGHTTAKCATVQALVKTHLDEERKARKT